MVGDPSAAVVVRLYEDPRCPACEEFETSGAGPELRDATVLRDAVTEYTLASFLDDRVGGSGSKKAVNALRAALEEGRFAEYHEVLYDNQPEGLRGPAFDSAVKGMKYRAFVTASEKAYERAGGKEEPEGPGTPTAVINDVRIPAEYNGLLFDGAVFTDLLAEIRDAPGTWREYEFPAAAP